jgi:hypothetical protein
LPDRFPVLSCGRKMRSRNVRYRMKSGRHLLILSSSRFDPTRKSQTERLGMQRQPLVALIAAHRPHYAARRKFLWDPAPRTLAALPEVTAIATCWRSGASPRPRQTLCSCVIFGRNSQLDH